MKFTKKTIGLIMATCILGIALIITPRFIFAGVKGLMDGYNGQKEAMKEDHWVYDENGRKYVYHDGVLIQNTEREIDGTLYYFDEKGYVKSGWVTDKGSRYYIGEDGKPVTGWLESSDGAWYYLNESGIPSTGWVSDADGSWYYMKEDGKMATGWITVSDLPYYLQEDGKMLKNGWMEKDGNRYYLEDSGKAAVGWRQLDNFWYYFREDGAMIIGWVESNGTHYLLNADGHMVTNTWQDKDGKRYYLGEDGRAVTGWFTIDDVSYFFNGDGSIGSAGWVNSSGKWYYLKDNGTATIGWIQDGTDWYYLNKDGSMATGWITIDKKEYFFKDNGVWDSTAAKKNTGGPMVALTFDDGPGQYTDRILNTLSANGAKATFFMLGKNVPQYPDALRKMESLGCELANHTYDHTSLNTLDASGIQNEVNSTNANIAAIVGHGGTLLRPPYGAYNDTVKANVSIPMVLWSIDTLDWSTLNAQSTYNAVMNAVDGDIILMHDIHGPTADAVDMIVPALKAKGFQMVTVSELAAAKGKPLNTGYAYGSIR